MVDSGEGKRDGQRAMSGSDRGRDERAGREIDDNRTWSLSEDTVAVLYAVFGDPETKSGLKFFTRGGPQQIQVSPCRKERVCDSGTQEFARGKDNRLGCGQRRDLTLEELRQARVKRGESEDGGSD
jgi:hypothetical protein